ncbi:hypothetical protein [Kineococcus sp. SYSU DK005]|uniref:hypothetical protein n=1 Tax=Kineococcus sp. SYSU DK005 TaxID=3383126 RepID=UPI003D7E6EE8
MSEQEPAARDPQHPAEPGGPAAAPAAATEPAADPQVRREGRPGEQLGEQPGEEGRTHLVQVTRRRAPRYRAFVLAGVVVAFLVAAVVAVLTPPSGGYSQRALFGYLFVSLGIVCGLLGGLVAVLADRAGARPARSGRR